MYVADIHIVPRNHGLVVTCFLFTTLAVSAVILRVGTRVALVRNVGIDDAFITLAAFGTIGFLVSAMEQIRYGLGDEVNYAYIQNFLQSLYSTIICYTITHFSVKFSILFQCKRIFPTRTAQRLFLGLIIYLAAYGIFCILSSIFTCVPIAKYWNDALAGKCINRSNLHYAFAGVNIVNDLIILITPMPFLSSIQLARRAKFVLMGVFACGGFACIVAIIRLHSLYVNNSAPIDQQPIKGVDIAIWSQLEINVAIMCACVPVLKPLFVKVFPRLISSFTDSAKRSRTGHSAAGNIYLRSIDKPSASRSQSDAESRHVPRVSSGGIQIKVQKEFDVHASAFRRDDDSEKNLVDSTGQAWQTDVYTGSSRDLPTHAV